MSEVSRATLERELSMVATQRNNMERLLERLINSVFADAGKWKESHQLGEATDLACLAAMELHRTNEALLKKAEGAK